MDEEKKQHRHTSDIYNNSTTHYLNFSVLRCQKKKKKMIKTRETYKGRVFAKNSVHLNGTILLYVSGACIL